MEGGHFVSPFFLLRKLGSCVSPAPIYLFVPAGMGASIYDGYCIGLQEGI